MSSKPSIRQRQNRYAICDTCGTDQRDFWDCPQCDGTYCASCDGCTHCDHTNPDFWADYADSVQEQWADGPQD